MLEPLAYNDFVEQQIKYWNDKGVDWKYPTHDDDDNKNESNIKYTNEIIESFIMTVYKNITFKNATCKFVKLLLLFTHQTVVGRILASYAQIPEYLRNIQINNKEFTTIELLEWKWNEKSGKNGKDTVIEVDFRRVYLIFLTNYLNRIWQFYHIDLDKENLENDCEEYIHIKSIQESLNDIINSTKESTKTKEKLSKAIVFEKIAENSCSLCGGIIDALRFKYSPITVCNLQQLYNVISLITLQINELYRPIEQEWINHVKNYTKSHFKNKSGDENFVTLVIKDQFHNNNNKKKANNNNNNNDK